MHQTNETQRMKRDGGRGSHEPLTVSNMQHGDGELSLSVSDDNSPGEQEQTRQVDHTMTSIVRHAASPGTATNTSAVLWGVGSAGSLATTRTL